LKRRRLSLKYYRNIDEIIALQRIKRWTYFTVSIALLDLGKSDKAIELKGILCVFQVLFNSKTV
jgi:hypothetical protein